MRPRIPGPPTAVAAAQRAHRALGWAKGATAGAAAGGNQNAEGWSAGRGGGNGSGVGLGTGALALRWSRRRRDRVDEVLTREARDEEPSWTCYDQEATCLKVEVADQLLAVLLDDTAKVIQDVLDKRESRKTQDEDTHR